MANVLANVLPIYTPSRHEATLKEKKKECSAEMRGTAELDDSSLRGNTSHNTHSHLAHLLISKC